MPTVERVCFAAWQAADCRVWPFRAPGRGDSLLFVCGPRQRLSLPWRRATGPDRLCSPGAPLRPASHAQGANPRDGRADLRLSQCGDKRRYARTAIHDRTPAVDRVIPRAARSRRHRVRAVVRGRRQREEAGIGSIAPSPHSVAWPAPQRVQRPSVSALAVVRKPVATAPTPCAGIGAATGSPTFSRADCQLDRRPSRCPCPRSP